MKYSWNPGATGIAIKNYDGTWDFSDLSKGDSVVVTLFQYYATGFSASCTKIAIQLPAAVHAGQTLRLQPVPYRRPAHKERYDEVAAMKDGEIVAVEFSNPSVEFLSQPKLAVVEILSVDANEALIRLRLKEKNQRGLDLDINEQFVLKVKAPLAKQ